MSELTDRYKEAAAARFQSPPYMAPDMGPDFAEQMDNLQAHHECPEKRVKGTCRHVLND